MSKDESQIKTGESYDFQKSLKESSPYPFLRWFRVERYFTRPLASVIARLAFRTAVTPNQLTLVSLLLGIAAAAAFLGGRHAWFALAGILVQLSSIFDCADGMLARSRNACTRFGAYLDLFCDRVADFLIGTGMAVGWFFHSGDRRLLFLGLIVVGLYFLHISLYYLMREYQRAEKTGQEAEARGLTFFIIFIGSLFGRLDILILTAIAVTLMIVIMLIVRFARWGRRGDQA